MPIKNKNHDGECLEVFEKKSRLTTDHTGTNQTKKFFQNTHKQRDMNTITDRMDGIKDGIKGWKVQPSRTSMHSKNYIRDIVDHLPLEPNPEKSVIALSIGDPCVYGNLKPPIEAIHAIQESIQSQKFNGYAPCAGHQTAKEALATYLTHDNVYVEPKNIFLCSGCSSALDLAITVLADGTRNHNILVPRPGFPIYRTLAEGIGVKARFYDLMPHKNWMIDLLHLEEQIDENTAAIVINNPSNPCGSVYSPEHLLDILEIAKRYKLPIIADEIYEQLVFPEKVFTSMAALSSEVPLLVCGGLAKRFLVPGWRLGWIVIHDPLGIFEGGVRKGLQNLSARIIGSNTLIQGALGKILLLTPQSFHDDLINTLHENAKTAYDELKNVRGLKPLMPEGTMYMMVEIEKDNFPQFNDTLELLVKMMEEESVFCLPGECFGIPNFMRIVITPPVDMLREACRRIADFCARYYT